MRRVIKIKNLRIIFSDDIMAEGDRVSGLLFVALMFIGAGIGLLFGRPDVGGTVGMGAGFLAMALIKARYREVKAEKTAVISPLAGSLVLGLIGILFITTGLALLFNVQIPWRILGGLGALALGLLFIAAAFNLVKTK